VNGTINGMARLPLLLGVLLAGCSFDARGLPAYREHGTDRPGPVILDGARDLPRFDTPTILVDTRSPIPCTPQSCTGCCTGNDCRPGNGTSFCGVGGGPCIDCSTTGQACNSGVCGPQPGLCTTNAECLVDDICVATACVPPHGRDFVVTVVSAEGADQKPSGGSWDIIWPWLPDAFCVVKLAGVQKLKTAIKADTLAPVWNAPVTLRLEKTAVLRIECSDDDGLSSEPIGSVEWAPEVPGSVLKAGTDTKGASALTKLTVTFKPL
jgi:hypothetical protein